MTKCVTTPQHPSIPTYEEVKVDYHSEATEMTANSAYGLQHYTTLLILFFYNVLKY